MWNQCSNDTKPERETAHDEQLDTPSSLDILHESHRENDHAYFGDDAGEFDTNVDSMLPQIEARVVCEGLAYRAARRSRGARTFCCESGGAG